MENKLNTDVLVSFIIPHHGREQLLVDTVQSIAAQQVDGRIEVLIMSKSGSDGFDDVLHSTLRAQLPDGVVDVFSIPQDKTISYGRNQGAVRAQGKYLAFIDADVRLATDWVAQMIATLDGSKTVLLSAAVQWADHDRADIDVIKSSMSQANAGSVNALPGNALFIEKSMFETHPQFPEHLETCEDWVFTNTLAMHGDVILSDQTHFVHLGEDKNYRTLFQKEIWRGTSNLGSVRGRKIEFAEWPSFIVPVFVAVALLLALLVALIGQFWFALILLLFGLLAPLLYTLRLKKKSDVPVGIPRLVSFYAVYFVARAFGMTKGLLSGETLRESSR